MTFEEWLTAQYALHTSYGTGMESGKQSDIKEYMQAAWEAGYEQGYDAAILYEYNSNKESETRGSC